MRHSQNGTTPYRLQECNLIFESTLRETKCKYYVLNSEIEERPKYKRGRPKGGIPEIKEMRYGLLTTITEDEKSVSKLRQQAGCFVMLTNVPKD